MWVAVVPVFVRQDANRNLCFEVLRLDKSSLKWRAVRALHCAVNCCTICRRVNKKDQTSYTQDLLHQIHGSPVSSSNLARYKKSLQIGEAGAPAWRREPLERNTDVI